MSLCQLALGELVLTVHLLDGQNRLVVVANLRPKIKKRKINAMVTLNNATTTILKIICSIYLQQDIITNPVRMVETPMMKF